jgi:type IV pilus assembly protein PilE
MIEMMIVLLIVAILAAIAYPSYQESVFKTRRAEGRAALARTMQQQERYFSLHATYIAFSAESSDANEKKFKWFSGDNARSSFYEISAKACGDESMRNCVMLIAQPGTAKVNSGFRDLSCGVLTLNSRGERTAGMERCWK